jgi:DMSO/TMAO reductase YedYZ molybdopterin-dependent catalytic subunit
MNTSEDKPKAPESALSRKSFISRGALAAFSAMLGAELVFGKNLPEGIVPVGLAGMDLPAELKGKHPEMVVLNDKPWNLETPPHLLDDDITPADKLFVRNNGVMPTDAQTTLTFSGESVIKKTVLTLADLKSKFKHYSYQLVLECAGNGRKEIDPPTQGLQWSTGAVGCAKWTGVRLKDVLNHVGIKSDAVYIGYVGRDTHLSGDAGKPVISRGVPMAKALEDESLIAWAMNDADIPLANGYPLRLVFGGWPASCSGKWLSEIMVRNKVHDGAKMGGHSYRMPRLPVEPGTEVPENLLDIIGSMPVKSLITYPKTGASFSKSRTLDVRGHAWAGDHAVSEVHVSIDFGVTWQKANLLPPPNRLAWQRWTAQLRFPQEGYYEIWVRATDDKGITQPMVVPGWNPGGYLNNAAHRIAVKVHA